MSPRLRLSNPPPPRKVVPKGVYERRGGWELRSTPLVVWRGRRCESPFGKAIRRSTFTCLTFTCLRAVNKKTSLLFRGRDSTGETQASGGGRRWRGAKVNLGKCVFVASVTQRAAPSSSARVTFTRIFSQLENRRAITVAFR